MTSNQYNALNKRLGRIENAILHIDHNLTRLLGERDAPISPGDKADDAPVGDPPVPLTQQPPKKP